MKQMLLIFCTLVVATISFYGESTSSFMENLANVTQIAKNDVEICFNNSIVTMDDMIHFLQATRNHTKLINFDGNMLKVGCLFTCLGQKKGIMTGAVTNVDKMKEIVHTKLLDKPDVIALCDQTIDMCADRVKNITNECEMGLKFLACLENELHLFTV